MLGCRYRPYHVEYAGSRPITEAKQRWARLVLGRETAWEHRVLMALFCNFPTSLIGYHALPYEFFTLLTIIGLF